MSATLTADFTKRFAGGAVIEAAFRCPAEGAGTTVLYGPSGCGKTTILRCLAGLEQPERGVIRCGAVTWFDAAAGVCLPPQRRGVGFLFQEYALFPHLTVAANIGYGLARSERRRIAELLDLLQLTGLDERYPRQLSGGQQQRVALARALAPRPRLLLLDEPLSALDGPTREQLRGELRRLLATAATPAVLVTHDRVEAMALADQLIVLDAGKIRQAGPVHEVFSRPADLTVARIVGVETVEPGRVLRVADGLATVAVGRAELLAVAPDTPAVEVYVCIRAEEVVLQKDMAPTSARNRLAGRVVSLVPEGPLVRVGLDCGFALAALVTRPACDELHLREGDTVTVLLKAPAIHLLPRGASGQNRAGPFN